MPLRRLARTARRRAKLPSATGLPARPRRHGDLVPRFRSMPHLVLGRLTEGNGGRCGRRGYGESKGSAMVVVEPLAETGRPAAV